MSFKVGIAGLTNTGKSYSRRTIPDGENVFLITPSQKTTNLVTSKGEQLNTFDFTTDKYKNIQHAVSSIASVNNEVQLIKSWNAKVEPGHLKPENLKGNIKQIDNLELLPPYIEFVSKHLPWIHTLILPDFTHHISNVISKEEFIARRAGGEAFEKFWELAGAALRNFILSIDDYRSSLLVVTEFHAHYNENRFGYEIFVPAGNMLTGKFLVPSYYDFLLFTDVKTINEGEDNERADYRFVTRSIKRYPDARSLNLFEDLFIPNDLNLVLQTVRKHLNLPPAK